MRVKVYLAKLTVALIFIDYQTAIKGQKQNKALGSGDVQETKERNQTRRASLSLYMDHDRLEEVKPLHGDEESRPQDSSMVSTNNSSLRTNSSKSYNLPVVNSSGSALAKASNNSSNCSFDYSRSGNFSAFSSVKSSRRNSARSSLMSAGSSSLKKEPNLFSRALGYFHRKDEYSKLKSDFIIEMRQLSKLRHPCITTVMGAVIDRGEEPMLVMEFMQLGSLYDLLHNESMAIEGEIILPILKDVVQGLRFLHAYDPPVIHGDLKAQNILVDSKLRAKVADFGLSQKKRVGATGTPLWMAPELLVGKAMNSVTSDCYSFGIMLYEIYSRKEPYEGMFIKQQKSKTLYMAT